MKSIFFAFLAIAVSSISAAAATYEYNYTFSTGQVVTGSFVGTLQGDSNTIFITDISPPSLDGVVHSGGVSTLFTGFNSGGGTPTASLDGSVMDFSVADPLYTEGFAIKTNAGTQYFDLDLQVGLADPESFNGQRWAIQEVPPTVPLPASGILLLLGAGGLWVLSRRKTASG
ncbi:hypothetical protein [Aestuariivita boseongensis]|uniref:hypothetical protein n=1 Tax=Aestuariivita boseongensis TaxID=1470562 RepID=UPI000680696C|nr:hypothetical protein [Aestuariivita boseongensis]